MKTIVAFQTSDGKLFTDEGRATAHQNDLLGEMLDSLLPYDDRGNITRIDRFNILKKMLDDPNLSKKISALHNALTFNEEEI